MKGLPGASRIRKNETVISTSMVGMAESMRRMMNFSISYLLGAWWVGICLNTGRRSERGSDAWGGFLFFVVRPLVFGVCGLLLLWSSETGFWVSDDLFADAFRGQSPRYGCFPDDLWGWRGFVVRTRAMVVSDDLCRQRASGSVRLTNHAFAAPSVSGSRRRRTSAW